jgi:hypothetical protein
MGDFGLNSFKPFKMFKSFKTFSDNSEHYRVALNLRRT